MQNTEELRDKIFLLLGKHLIRFQTVEMRLKSLLKLNRTIILENKNSPLVIEPPVRNQTLGGLSTKALNSLFLLDSVEEDQLIKEGTNTLRIDMKFSFNLSIAFEETSEIKTLDIITIKQQTALNIERVKIIFLSEIIYIGASWVELIILIII